MPDSVVATFTDPNAYHAAIRDTHAEGIVTERGNFRAESTSIWLDRLSLQRCEEALPRVAYSAVDPARHRNIFATYPGPPLHASGLELPPGHIIAFRAGSEGHNRSTAPSKWGSISLMHEDLAAAGQTIGRELSAPSSTQRITPPSLLLSRLLNVHEAVGHLAKTAPDILAKPEVARALEQALVEAMVSCLSGGESIETNSAHCRHVSVMWRLEHLLEANPDHTLYLAELCAATGVSDSTLRACCQEHLGMSPKHYLWLRRMYLARRALRMADSVATTVTEIATNYGFWELGRFSVAYRSLFRESPSASLSRPPEDPRSQKNTGSPWQFAESA